MIHEVCAAWKCGKPATTMSLMDSDGTGYVRWMHWCDGHAARVDPNVLSCNLLLAPRVPALPVMSHALS